MPPRAPCARGKRTVRPSRNTLVSVADVTWTTSTDYTRAVNRSVGTAVRAAREVCGLTQDTLASTLGISRASIANIERGEQTVSVPLLLRLATALDVLPTQLLQEIEGDELAWLHLTDNNRELLGEQLDDDRAKRWVAGLLFSDPQP